MCPDRLPQLQQISPRLWIRSLSIYRSAEPLQLIRRVSFGKGLNLVLGLEKDGVVLGGHSVGKTTLCRLIRYGLGEARFATKEQEEVITQTFPDGWVTLDLIIDGEEWGIARPFSRGRARSRACRNEAAEALLLSGFEGNEYTSYLDTLQALMPEQSEFSWNSLLSWLTRDQECSFNKMGEWRSPLSQSDSPGLSQKEADAIMRCILGIFRKEEVEVAEEVKALKKAQTSAKGAVEQATHFPKLEYNITQAQLYASLGIVKPDRDITPLEAELAVGEAQAKLDEKIEPLEKELESLEADYVRFLALKMENEAKLEVLRGDVSAKIGLTESSKTGDRSSIYLQAKSAVHHGKFCLPGNIYFAKCEAVQAHIRLREQGNRLTIQDFHTQAEYQKHCKELRELQAQEKFQAEAFEALDKEIKSIEADVKKVKIQISALYRKKDALGQQVESLKTCFAVAATPEANQHLATAQNTLNRTEEELLAVREVLSNIRKQREASHVDLEKAYASLIQNVFGPETSGLVSFKEHLDFKLTGNRPSGGPALSGLARVLADITVMLSAQTGFNHHPGFLVHDGPKVFELDSPFQQVLNFIAQKTEELGGKDLAPFQYIVTATAKSDTENSLKPFVCLELAAKPDKFLLFRQQLIPALEQQSLPNDDY